MEKLLRQSLTDQIFDYIRRKILSGEWKPGEKLPSEAELASILGVSRMSVRSALQRSNAIGFTETRVGDGTYVVDFSMQTYFQTLYDFKVLEPDYQQINEFRMVIHLGSMRLAFLRGDDFSDTIADLEKINESMDRSLEAGDYQSFADADYRFHKRICAMSKNSFMDLLYEAISPPFFEVARSNVNRSISSHNSSKLVIQYHREILDGLRQRDLEKCIHAEVESLLRSYRYYGEENKLKKQDSN